MAAGCTGSSPTWTSTPDRTSVNTCANNAVNGDTINVTAGSAAWSSEITINGKAISIIGGNGGTTTLTGGTFFSITSNTTNDVNVRISTFTMNSTVDSPTFQIDSDGGGQAPRGFRIDHITRGNTTGGWVTFAFGWGKSTSSWKGLFDHNTITNGRIWWFGEESSTAGRYRWSEPTNLGTADAVYIEDNTFIVTSPSALGHINQIDGNWGSRLVARFNTFTNGRIEQHGLQGDNERGVRLWEIYNNIFTSQPGDPVYRFLFIRGATGVIFENTGDGDTTVDTLDMDNPRTIDPSISVPTWGLCNVSSSFVDGNQSSGEGYLCRDQIGSGQDASLWDYSNPSPAQAKEPAYLWNNTNGGSPWLVGPNCSLLDQLCVRETTKHLVENRDWYQTAASFNGTVGVGRGTLAARPAPPCTTGVAYWATDQGEWNSLNPGPDGQLYQCTSTGTWALYYIPYTYPHPLQK